MHLVALGKFRDGQRPSDAEFWILDVECALGFGVKGRGVQVKQFAVVGECLKAMSEALRDQQAAVVLGGENCAMPV